MPIVVIIAAGVLYCMKSKRKRDQQKEDAEARKQNERNATATLQHGNSINSSKRSSSTGLNFDNSNPTIIKNTWDKSVNNISSSASVDECLMNTNCYNGAYNDGDCFAASATTAMQIAPLQRAKSQKQLNTDPSVMHRASQIIHNTKDYMNASAGSAADHKRISCIANGNANGNASSCMTNDALLCGSQRWPSSSPRKSFGPCNPSHM